MTLNTMASNWCHRTCSGRERALKKPPKWRNIAAIPGSAAGFGT